MREFLKRTTCWIYPKIFGEELGPATIGFIKNIGYVGFGFVLAAIFALIFQIYVGRMLGPSNYGMLELVRAVSVFLIIPLAFVNTGLTKYLAEFSNKDDRKSILSMSLLMTVIMLFTLVPLYLIFSPNIANLIQMQSKYFVFALVLAAAGVVNELSRRFAQGLGNMKKVGVMAFSRTSVALLIVLIFFVLLGKKHVDYAIIAVILGYLVTGVIIFFDFLKYFRTKIDRKWLSVLWNYGIFNLLGNAAYVFFYQFDRVLINRFLDISHVGIYQAYFLATMGVATYLIMIFDTVFFPESSKRDKRVVWRKLKRVMRVTPFMYIFTLVTCIVIITLYGDKYPFMLSMVLLFPLLCAIRFAYASYNWFLASLGIKGVQNSFYCIFIAAIINLVLNILLLPKVGIVGAVLSPIIAYLLVFPLLLSKIKSVMESLG